MVNMNMIVNKSDLVGYEAVDRTKARKEALAKIVAAWESKQARNAARFGGLGFLAVSLAACNSSSDDVAAPAAHAAPAAPTVTALTQALATSGDVITSTFTSGDDNITAVGTAGATVRTLNAGDVLVDNSSTDNDTLTVTTTDGTAIAPATVTGIENVVYNNTGFAASNVDVANIIGANITVNNSANAQVANNTSTVSNLSTNSSLTLGTNITAGSTLSTAAGAVGATVNAGASEITLTSGGSNENLTVNGGTSTTMDVTLQSTDKGSNITGGSGAGVQTVDFGNATTATNTFTSGAAATNTVGQNMVTGTIISGNTTGTATTKTTIDIDGNGATGDAATVKGAGHITLDSNVGNDAANQIEALTLAGNGAAVHFYMKDANDAPTTVVLSGDQSVTMEHTLAQFAAITSVTDSTTAGTTIAVVSTATAGNTDLKGIGTDQITLNAAAAFAGDHVLTVKDGMTINYAKAVAQTHSLDIDDGATTNTTAGSLTLNLTGAITTVIKIDATASSDNVATVNVVALGDQTAGTLAIQDQAATNAIVINASGAKALSFAATTEAKELNASAMTGKLTAESDAGLLKITGGSGDDSITLDTGIKNVIDGGAGADEVVTKAGGDYTQATLSNIEVIDIAAGAATFKASQMSGKSFIVDSDGADTLTFTAGTAGANQDLSTVNLSTLTFSDTTTLVSYTTGNTLSTALFNSTVGINLTGTTQADTVATTQNADTISTGAGDDTITGGKGSDTIDAGAGADTINFQMELTAGDVITGGAGNDAFTMTTDGTATMGVTKITDIDLGTATTAKDTINVSITALELLTTTTQLSDTSNNNAANADNGAVAKVTTDGGTIANADLVILSQTYANDAAALAGMKTAGKDTIDYGTDLEDNDSFLVAYTDGTNSYIAVATSGGTTLDTTEGLDSVATIIELSGITSLASLDTTDFDVIT